jgi:hypothetical protein
MIASCLDDGVVRWGVIHPGGAGSIFTPREDSAALPPASSWQPLLNITSRIHP